VSSLSLRYAALPSPLYSAMPCTESSMSSAASHSLQFTRFHIAFNLKELQEQEVFGFFAISAGN
jgi:hypothetical protein